MAVSTEGQKWLEQLKTIKKILKTKITKTENQLMRLCTTEKRASNPDDIKALFHEYNQIQRELAQMFREVTTIVADDEKKFEQYVDEELEIKAKYRRVKKIVENALSTMECDLNNTISSAFTDLDIKNEEKPVPPNVSLRSSSPISPSFHGFTPLPETMKKDLTIPPVQSIEETTMYTTANNTDSFRHAPERTNDDLLIPVTNTICQAQSELFRSQFQQNHQILQEKTPSTNQQHPVIQQLVTNQPTPFKSCLSNIHPWYLPSAPSLSGTYQFPTQPLSTMHEQSSSKPSTAQQQKVSFVPTSVHQSKTTFPPASAHQSIFTSQPPIHHSTPHPYFAQSHYQNPQMSIPAFSQPFFEHPYYPSIPSTQPIKLQPLTLAQFDGSYEKWESFRDMYEAMIHNAPMSSIEKFQRLKELLIGTAAAFVSNIQISEANYMEVWHDIKEYFDNPRRIIATHIQCMIDLKPLSTSNALSLRKVVDQFKSHIRALKSANQDDNAELLQLQLLVSKLDKDTRQKWESKMSIVKEPPRLQDLYNVLEKRIRALEVNPIHNTYVAPPKRQYLPENKSKFSYHVTPKTNTCRKCNQSHSIYKCDVFRQATPSERLKFIDEQNLCRNCLQAGHELSYCNSGNCREKDCAQKHHTLLHEVLKTKKPSLTSTALFSKFCESLLATGIAIVNDADGNLHKVRILFDSGSQCNFMTEALCEKLKLDPRNEAMEISGIGKSASKVNRSVPVTLMSHSTDYKAAISCFLMKEITESLPQNEINISNLNIPKTIKLSDPEFHKPARIDILLSASIFFDALSDGILNLGDNNPKLFNSQFGWIVAGGGMHKSVQPSIVSCHTVTKKLLHQLVENFWEIETFPENQRVRTVDDEICESHFNENYRIENGKFVVKLPFKAEHSALLGNNRKRAESCWLATEKKFLKDEQLKPMYSEFMNTYLKMGHMKEASPKDDIKYFIPHHHVWKQNTSEKKFRVVFNASSKTHSGLSLNDILYIGPKIQDDLINLLIRFREHEIVLVGDVEKMYRQINVDNSDQSFQGIVWREDCKQPLKAYKLCTLTYGTAPAAFIATRCLKEIANLCQNSHALAINAISNDFYMDDLLTGASSKEQAIELRQNIQHILQSYGFPMRKWISNNREVLNSIPAELCELKENVNLDADESIKTLGMIWSPLQDHFQFFVTEFQTSITKRTVLSDIAKLFDPLGLIAPVIFTAKCLMQSMWKQNLQWDDELPTSLNESWSEFKQTMINLHHLKINRKLFATPDHEKVKLFGFSDASEKGYSACVYAVTSNSNNTISSNLVCSKSRVAPTKTQSIPRLELCGALLLAELVNSVQQTLVTKIHQVYCFTDSKIVLAWLAKEPASWKVFVANRTSKIQSLIPNNNWHHVTSSDNPADILSRGASPAELINSSLWWHGPYEFIKNHWFNKTQSNLNQLSNDETQIIHNESKLVVKFAVPAEETFIDKLLSKFSKLNFVIRIVAYIHRFINNCKASNKLQLTTISYQEYLNSLYTIARNTQKKFYRTEIHAIETGRSIPTSSKILCLNPIWDQQNKLLRVGGRISNADLSEARKHQIILPSDAEFTKKLFEMEHQKLLHAGPQLLLNHLRNIWWPINGKRIANTTVHKCVICFKRRPKTVSQIMGDLPKQRLVPTKTFFNSGVDFAGPIKVKQNEGPRCTKVRDAWICIFVCCSTKAVHLDLVSNYTADAFVACLRRFVARRGKVRNIYCDNGTNFVGANNMLRKLMLDTKVAEQIDHEFEYIDFHFAPARSPHMGGLYEANIRSMKNHLNRIMGRNLLNFEQLQTLLTQIEACLNSRPICTLPSNTEEVLILTPGHFLTGSSMTTLPDADYLEVNPNRLDKWCQIQQALQQFWKIWHSEYIDSLQNRYKWKISANNLKPGDVVVVKEENVKPLHWKLGRVTQIFPDKFKNVRVVQIYTNKHYTKRSVHKLCKLPINDDVEELEKITS